MMTNKQIIFIILPVCTCKDILTTTKVDTNHYCTSSYQSLHTIIPIVEVKIIYWIAVCVAIWTEPWIPSVYTQIQICSSTRCCFVESTCMHTQRLRSLSGCIHDRWHIVGTCHLHCWPKCRAAGDPIKKQTQSPAVLLLPFASRAVYLKP